jgi:hypothetical protein
MAFHVPEKYRLQKGAMKSTEADGNNGVFIIPSVRSSIRSFKAKRPLIAQASDGLFWEHVSVSSVANRCPYWDEMNFIKDMFWDDEDTVIQYHPPKSEYVDVHPYVLHLWRPVGVELPRPPKIMVLKKNTPP